jgi:hypothetical protein
MFGEYNNSTIVLRERGRALLRVYFRLLESWTSYTKGVCTISMCFCSVEV